MVCSCSGIHFGIHDPDCRAEDKQMALSIMRCSCNAVMYQDTEGVWQCPSCRSKPASEPPYSWWNSDSIRELVLHLLPNAELMDLQVVFEPVSKDVNPVQHAEGDFYLQLMVTNWGLHTHVHSFLTQQDRLLPVDMVKERVLMPMCHGLMCRVKKQEEAEKEMQRVIQDALAIGDGTPADIVSQITSKRGPIYGPFLHNGIVAQNIKDAMRNIPDPDNEGSRWRTLAPDIREALDLIALKMSRILTGDSEHLDNWDDIGGYAKIVADRLRATNNPTTEKGK